MKSSVLAVAQAGPLGVRSGRGWEAGRLEPAGSRPEELAAPLVPMRPAPADTDLAERAAALRRELIAAVALDPAAVVVEVSCAAVTEDPGDGVAPVHRRVESAQALLGAAHGPRWTRLAPLAADSADWPPGFLEAAAREVAGWDLPLAARELPDDAPIVVDAFAAADLLRLEARRWLSERPRPGTRVGREAFRVEDAGPLFRAEGERDALGRPVRAYRVVDAGRLGAVPGGSDADDAGTSVRTSWREPPRPGWRSLAVAATPASSWPDDGLIVTRVAVLGPHLLVSGWRREAGRPSGAVLYRPMTLVECSPAGAAGWLGPPVADVTGLPVAIAAARVR
jgi:hypothetical protein